MPDTVLQALRARLMDESEPLAGLLRICLMLGAETKSDALREWARHELNGYQDDGPVPSYRRLSAVILFDSISGNTWATGQSIHPLQLPGAAGEDLPDELTLPQPIEELEHLATTDSTSFRTGPLSLAEVRWNRELGAFQQVMSLRYTVSGSTVAGIIGQVRTNLVEIVADLTADTPLTELPPTARVDQAVRDRVGHVGDVYNTNINQPSGPTAVGAHATATTASGLGLADVLRLLDEIQLAVADASDDERAEVDLVIGEVREVVEQPEPDTGEVVRRAGRLRSTVEKLGIAAASASAGSATSVLTELALGGTFG